MRTKRSARLLGGLLLMLVVSACTAGDSTSSTDDTALPSTTSDGSTTTVSGSSEDSSSGDTARQGGILRVGHTTDVLGFHPDQYASAQDRDVITNIYDTLVEYDLETYEIVPSLAESWSTSEDGRVWTFELRSGVVFHDGSSFTADDVVASIDRAMEPTAPRTSGLLSFVEEAVAVDEGTVEVHLSAPDRVLLSTLVDVYISPDDTSIDLAQNPVGTGPFKLLEWQQNQFVELEKNPDYWREGLPYLDGIVFRTTPELNVLALQLRTGDLDLIYEAPLSEMGPFQEAGVQLIPPNRVFSIFNLYVNARRPPWDSQEIRQAASKAIDRTAINNALFGFMQVRSNPLEPLASEEQPEDDFFNESAMSYNERDLEGAQQLVAEAGFPDGVDGGEMIICSVAGFQFDTMGQLIQSQLAEAGITVEINPIPDGPTWASRQNGDRAGEYELSLCGQGAKPDPYDLVNHTYDKQNTESMGWIDHNPGFYDALEAARSIADPVEYQEAILELQAEAMEGQPNIVIGGRPVFVAAQSHVKGFVAHTQAHMFFTEVWIDSAE